MRHYLGILAAVLLLAIPWYSIMYPGQILKMLSSVSEVEDQFASAILSHNPKSIADIQSKYAAASDNKNSDKKVRILIVPGHEPTYGGAEFGSLEERQLTVELGQDLLEMLKANDHYQVFITRDDQSWNPTFAAYFKNEWNDIIAWTKAHHQEMAHLIAVGDIKKAAPTVLHNSAPTDVAYRLYGITKWANENDIDIAIHIHFNDNPGHGRAAGDYSGFAIYIPEKQYDNSTTSKAVAESIFKRLTKYNPVSDLHGESSGIVEEPNLIAVGVDNTSDAASLLIEYGYIYEPQFTNATLRDVSLKDLAFQTYLGLQDFFDANNVVNNASAFDTLLLPHKWDSTMATKDIASSSDIYALQTALVVDGDYPPGQKSMNDCPRTGSVGPCTLTALAGFQKKYDITDEKGVVGPKTRSVLNSRFGGNLIL